MSFKSPNTATEQMANDLNAFLKDLSEMTQEQEKRGKGKRRPSEAGQAKREQRFIEEQIVTESPLNP